MFYLSIIIRLFMLIPKDLHGFGQEQKVWRG